MASSRALFESFHFSLVICRNPLTGKYLAVNETENRGWWIPGGGVDNAETFQHGAVRECMEEAGVEVDLKGILKVDHFLSLEERAMPGRRRSSGNNSASSNSANSAGAINTGGVTNDPSSSQPSTTLHNVVKMRVIFYAEPVDPENCLPKQEPDGESLGAAWVSLAEFGNIPKIRGRELLDFGEYLENGGHVMPLSFLNTGLDRGADCRSVEKNKAMRLENGELVELR
jgi:8-oxo-dGTP pyrophosphatase MutT (NUDIX family)